MKALARFILLAAALGILLMGCERKMNPIASSLSELDNLPLIQNGMSLMKGGNSIIAFQSDRSGDKEVYVMNTDGSSPIRLTYRDGHDGYPDLSPDGKKIAYESDRDGNLEIHVMNLDGTEQTCVTNSPTMDGDPDWSPDGKTILFGRLDGGVPEICTIRADGSDLKVLYVVGGTFYASPVWSPNGKKIAFQGNAESNYEIYVMNADGTGVTNLTNNDAVDWFPSWSPNGKKIAFISRRDGINDVYVMNADGSEQTKLTNNAGTGWSNPTWSTDGKQILFTQSVSGQHDIFAMNADGSGQINITNNPGSDDTAPNWGKGSLDKIDPTLIRDIGFLAPGFTASVFYYNIASPDGIARLSDKKLLVVRESNSDPGAGVFLAREGTQFSIDDAFSTLGLPFDSPDDLVLGVGNVLFVSDGQTETVYKLSHEGGAPVPFVTSITANTSLNPYGLAFAPPNFDGPNVDPGDLVIADNSYGNISRGVRAVNPNTGVVKVIAEGDVFADGPITVAFSSDGTLYVFENWGTTGTSRIVILSADGTVTPFITDIPPTFGGSLAIHPKTDELFFKKFEGEIWRIPKSGGTPQLFASNIGTFQDIEFDKDGTTLYISARGRQQIIQISAKKNVW